MRLFIFLPALLLAVVFIVKYAKSKRAKKAFYQLVQSCGSNVGLAEEVIQHEQLSDASLCRYRATLAALDRIQNYRRRGVTL